MASSFFSDFGLMWYLGELKKEEFKRFKMLLRKEAIDLGLEPIPWTEVRKATREDLANLLIKCYKEAHAWDVTFSIFHRIERKDLCEKAKRESAGYTKLYKNHVKKNLISRWSQELYTKIYEHFEPKERDYLELLFAPTSTGEQPRTVVVMGTPKFGKTTFLLKLIMAWAVDAVYRDKFLYVFYFCCREVKDMAATSLADLISRDWPSSSVPIAEIVSQPERLLFIVDSLEQMTCALSELESDLCSDWTCQQPGEVVLGSLLKKKMLPEASVLIATTGSRQQDVQDQLERPEVIKLMGFDESDRKLFFACFFQDRKRTAEAFRLIRENKQLFSMCKIPILCWLVCSCLKQEMERGRDPALACHSVTSVYTSFLLNSFAPKGAPWPHLPSQARIKGLCSLAAEGMWTNTTEFSDEDLGRNGLGESDISALLDLKLLQKCRGATRLYAFIHYCLQEFCAAMFYMITDPRDHPNPAVGSIESLLLLFLTRDREHWVFLGCFLFGLLHPEDRKKLEAFFGHQLSQNVLQHIYQGLKSLGKHELREAEVDFLTLFYSLFEMQDDVFVRKAMVCFPEIQICITDDADLMVSAYCLQLTTDAKKLFLSIQNVFDETNGNQFTSSCNLVHWLCICSVLITNKNLRTLQITESTFDESSCVALCKQLRDPKCRIQNLEMHSVSFSGKNWIFFEAFPNSLQLTYADIRNIQASHSDIRLLSNALREPLCNLEDLLLINCNLSIIDGEIFASVLKTNKKLKYLNLSYNDLGESLRVLFKTLCLPDCRLEALAVAGCNVREPFWENLCEVFLCSKKLVHIDVSANILKDHDLKQLCEAIRHPNCILESLCLSKCLLTSEHCRSIAAVLVSKPTMISLDIGENDIQDEGMKVLCEALANPNCRLENLGLEQCKLTSACCEHLASALAHNTALWRVNMVGNALGHNGLEVLFEASRHAQCPLKVLGLKKSDFDEETWVFVEAEKERNPSLTITEFI
ncbi:NACHT, LRR and PYD domains-containing protein 4-like [Tenrec ecaudatus]|uniref:NACHT, LRR and PYD domains-containing protein 4-like n=1 Tax=Tenrec ecaudatus TaxID=94439 RepID=UPI003F590936